jgi:Nucleotidyl transferase AbiEii toxin, Type IV TA system
MPERNVAASVRQRLLNLARQRGEDFQLILVRYANERLLYRLSQSSHTSSFVLKGATLFSVWSDTPHRATRDIDLLGSGPITAEFLGEVFSGLCRTALRERGSEDGLSFDETTVRVRPIREENIYGGLRVTLECKLGSARVPLQVDVGLGDAYSSSEIEIPTLLSLPAPRLAAYDRETVIAEKLEATIKLGTANSRMKDFYDLATLGAQFSFEGSKVCEAIVHTFRRRNTELSERPLRELLTELVTEPASQVHWRAFQRKAAPRSSWSLEDTMVRVAAFAGAPLAAVASSMGFGCVWSPGGPWRGKQEA